MHSYKNYNPFILKPPKIYSTSSTSENSLEFIKILFTTRFLFLYYFSQHYLAFFAYSQKPSSSQSNS